MRKATRPEVMRSICFKVTILLFFLIPQIILAYSTDYRFIGQPYDSSSDLYYFNQRYYNPEIGRFTQSDPLRNFLATSPLGAGSPLSEFLSNPQRLNYYSYAGNNPMVLVDPTGLLTVIIPGTYYNEKNWSESGSAQAFINSVAKSFKETHSTQVINDKNVWSGADNDAARQKAADHIAQLIKNYGFAAGEELNIVGHSHGGNIAILVSQKTNRKIDNLVTLATPVRADYQPNYAIISRHLNAYSIIDMAQFMGGGQFLLSKLIGGLLLGPVGGWLGGKFNFGEFGLAGRAYQGAENVAATKATFSINPVRLHANFWVNSKIWRVIDRLIN